jgi:hypothetical protein
MTEEQTTKLLRLYEQGWSDLALPGGMPWVEGQIFLTREMNGEIIRLHPDGSIEVAIWSKAILPEELAAITKRLSDRWRFENEQFIQTKDDPA